MATYPKSFADVIDAAAKKHKNNVEAAVEWAEAKLSELPEFVEWKERMALDKIRELISHRRRDINSPNHSRVQQITTPQRREIDLPDVVSAIADRITLDYFIAGKTLGTTYGRDLPKLSLTNWGTAQTAMFMSHVLDKLTIYVPADKQVAECVNARKLEQIVAEVERGSLLVPPSSAMAEAG